MRVTVLKAHRYGPKWRGVGEEYDCSPKFLNVLLALGKVEVSMPKRVEVKPKAEAVAPPPTDVVETVAVPSAEAMAAEHGIDLTEIEGTGKEGKILRRDVQTYLTTRLKADD